MVFNSQRRKVDTEKIVIRFPSAWMLMQELGMMGEGNAVFQRRERTPLSTLLAAAAYYQQNYQLDDATIPATFEVSTKHPKTSKTLTQSRLFMQ